MITRDLMKWCSRIVVDFDIKSTATGNKVFQEALDIFCACLSKMEKRLAVAEAVGAQLNITKVKVWTSSLAHIETVGHLNVYPEWLPLLGGQFVPRSSCV